MRSGLAGAVFGAAAIGSFLACSSFSSSSEPLAMAADSGPVPPDAPAPSPDAEAASAYRAAVLADGPIAYWRMDIATGSVVPDETGHGHTLALSGGITLGAPGATADGDPAITFDGLSGAGIVDKPRDFDFAGGAPFTIECFARRAEIDGGSTFRHMVSALSVSTGYPGVGYQLYEALTGSGGVQFELDFGDSGVTATTALPSFGQWTHYAVVVGDGTETVYVDGASKTSRPITKTITARTSPVTIARRSIDDSGFYAGDLDEIAIYDKALPASRIATHIDASKK